MSAYSKEYALGPKARAVTALQQLANDIQSGKVKMSGNEPKMTLRVVRSLRMSTDATFKELVTKFDKGEITVEQLKNKGRTLIEKKLPGRAVMASPWVRHILRREYQRIHPDLNVGYANAQIPFWGTPEVPILVLQAANDETLGDDHFILLKQHFNEISDIHVLNDMPHTSKVDVKERRDILEKFVNLKPSPLEKSERLEQLRALEAGINIHTILTSEHPIGVDTKSDLKLSLIHI